MIFAQQAQDVLKDIQNAKAVLKLMKNLTNLMQSVNNVQDSESST